MQNKNSKPSLAFYIDSMQKGGANRVVANLVNYFVECQYNVYLINDKICNDENLEYSVDSRVHREIINSNKKTIILSNISRIQKIRTILKKEKIDIVVSFMGPPNIRLLLAGICLKCKKFISVRNDPNCEYSSLGFIRAIIGILFSIANGCIFQTQEANKYFPKKVQKKSKIILNPVNSSFYQVERSLNTKDIVTVGRLVEQKNQKLLIDAFYKIKDLFPDEHLILYGEGPLRAELEQYTMKLGMTDRILFQGQVSDVANILAKASLFVLSSNYEGLPNALMEAMAIGLPVISTNCPCGGPKSLINNGIDGLLVSCNNIDELANSIRYILSNREYAQYLGQNASQKALSFHPNIIFKEWEEFLLECK